MKECSKCRHCFDDSYNFCPHDDKPLIATLSSSVIISGRYIIDLRLGKGGMGIVYKAKHKFLKSLHAIKLILPSIVEDDEELLVRFKQEAILAASINHPNVIRVTDFGVEDEIMPYLVMEFVDGIPLSSYLSSDQKMPVEKAFELFQPIALGVAEAHGKGIVHRDLKPQNIMVEKGLPLRKAVKVLDFGLAKIKSADSFGSMVQAKTTSFIGSPPYMSPEQWENEKVDHRTDIYSLGIILFQMLTGNLPFQAESIPSVMYQHFTAMPPTFASLGISDYPGIEAVVNKALEKDPEARYHSVEEMYRDFEKALQQNQSSSSLSIETAFLNKSDPSFQEKTDVGSLTVGDGKTAPLTQTQRDRLFTYFDAKTKTNFLPDEQLAQDFLQAQDRAEQAQAQVSQADKLVQELADAQKVAEDAQQKALEAKQRIEAEVRQRVKEEMENKMAVDEQNRQKAEAERLAREAEARKKAEERANYLAQAALEAQQIAEKERLKAEKELHQRELAESVRRRSEVAAAELAEQVADAKKQYEEAKQQAQYEAGLRQAAEAKRQKIETELHAIAQSETERRRTAEAEAQKQIKEQASRFEQEAQAARQRVDEARRQAELEIQKREEAEAAKLRAEEEARRLAAEILEVHRHIEEIKIHTTKSTGDRQIHTSQSANDQTLNLVDFHNSRQNRELSDSQSGLTRETPANFSANENTSDKPVSLTNVDYDAPKDTTQIHRKSSENIVGLLNTSPIQKRKISVPLVVAGALAAFFVVSFSGVGIYYFAAKKSDKPEIGNVNKNINNSTESSPTPILDTKNEAVLIKGGNFKMGRDDVEPTDLDWGNQFPSHLVNVDSFYISKTEVTNAEYSQFVESTGHPVPQNWKNKKPPEGQEQSPVTWVSLADTKAFADWVSKRDKKACSIPTEIQWEYAARNGEQNTTYPWGNNWDVSLTNVASGNVAEVGTTSDTTVVGGIKDLFGNVNEWTSTKYALYPKHPSGLASNQELYVIRGSSWAETPNRLENSKWMLTRRQSVKADSKYPSLGFRLVCTP